MNNGRQNKEIDTPFRKANAVLRELYRSVVKRRELSNKAKLSVSNHYFFRSSPTVLNPG